MNGKSRPRDPPCQAARYIPRPRFILQTAAKAGIGLKCALAQVAEDAAPPVPGRRSEFLSFFCRLSVANNVPTN